MRCSLFLIPLFPYKGREKETVEGGKKVWARAETYCIPFIQFRMGCIISEMAFAPPARNGARSVLKHKDIHYIENKRCKQKTSVLYISKAGPSTERLTVLYSHGNAEDLGMSYDGIHKMSVLLDVDIASYDYQGYGLSGRGDTCESNAFGDAEAAFSLLTKRFKIPRSRIVLMGRSLGSGPTVHLASVERGLAGMLLISPLSTAVSVMGCIAATVLYPCDIMTNRRIIHKVHDYPVHIIHGTADEVVPFAAAQELYAILKTKNTRVTHLWMKGCGHNNMEVKQGDLFREDLRRFIDSVRAPTDDALFRRRRSKSQPVIQRTPQSVQRPRSNEGTRKQQ